VWLWQPISGSIWSRSPILIATSTLEDRPKQCIVLSLLHFCLFFTFFWLIRTVDNINLLTQTDGKRRRAKSPSEVPGSWARPGVAYFCGQVPDRRPFGRWPDLAECSAWIMRAHSSINFHSFRHSPNFSLFAVRVPVLVPKPKAEKIHTSCAGPLPRSPSIWIPLSALNKTF